MHSAWNLVQENTLTNRSHYWYYYYLLRSCDIHFCVQGHSPLVICDSELQLWWVVPEHAVHTSQVPTESVLCFRDFPAAESSLGAPKRGPRSAKSCQTIPSRSWESGQTLQAFLRHSPHTPCKGPCGPQQ